MWIEAMIHICSLQFFFWTESQNFFFGGEGGSKFFFFLFLLLLDFSSFFRVFPVSFLFFFPFFPVQFFNKNFIILCRNLFVYVFFNDFLGLSWTFKFNLRSLALIALALFPHSIQLYITILAVLSSVLCHYCGYFPPALVSSIFYHICQLSICRQCVSKVLF